MQTIFNDVSNFWSLLSTVWGELSLQDKQFVETIWNSYMSSVEELFRQLYQVDLSKSLATMPSWIMYRYETYPIFFSGDNINVSNIGGNMSYYIPEWSFSVPTLSGINRDLAMPEYIPEILVEGIDYTVEDYHRISFTNWSGLVFDPTESENFVNYYVPVRYMYNPVLMELFAPFVGFQRNEIFDYVPFTGNTNFNRAEHFKYLSWGLWTKRRLVPTFSNVSGLLAIALGFPFAYTSGIAHVDGNIVRIGEHTQILPYDPAVVSGEFVDQFDILMSGFWFYDNVEFMPEIDTYWGDDIANESKLVARITVTGLQYNENYFNMLIASGIPAGISIRVIENFN